MERSYTSAMKSCVFGTLFLVIFLSYIHPGFGITILDDDTSEIFVQMVKGEFNIPVKERTVQQNAARVRFWRNKDKLSLQGGILCFEGKPIVKKSSLKGVVKKCFKKSKGSGTRKLYHKLKDSYSGVSVSSQNPQFIRNPILASKIEQGFIRFAHEMFRYDTRST